MLPYNSIDQGPPWPVHNSNAFMEPTVSLLFAAHCQWTISLDRLIQTASSISFFNIHFYINLQYMQDVSLRLLCIFPISNHFKISNMLVYYSVGIPPTQLVVRDWLFNTSICRPCFGSIWSSSEQSGLAWSGSALHTILRWPHIFEVPNLRKTLSCIQVNMVFQHKKTAFQISLMPQHIKLISRGEVLCTVSGHEYLQG
jgi:hypothetical protein